MKAEKDLKFNQFRIDASENINETRKNISKYDFDLREHESAQKILDSIEKRNEELFQETRFNKALDAGLELANGTLTQDSLSDLVLNGQIDPEIAGAFEIGLFRPELVDDKDPKTAASMYIETIEGLKDYNPDKAYQILKNAVKTYSKSKETLDRHDLSLIVNTIDRKRKGPFLPIWESVYSAVKWMGGLALADQTISLFMNLWDGKQDPIEIAQQAAQATSRNAIPEASQFEIDKRYKWGVYKGVNPKTGKLMFEE